MNRTVSSFFCFTSLLLSFCFAESEEELEARMATEQAIHDEFIVYIADMEREVAKKITKELDLYCSGNTGSRMHAKIENLGLSFTAKRRATIEEARALILIVLDQYLKAINSNEKIQPFLETRPFSPNQVEIHLEFQGIDGSFDDGTVYRVFNVPEKGNPENSNLFCYYNWVPCPWRSLKILEETYEEAIERNDRSPVSNPTVHQATEKEQEIDRLVHTLRKEITSKHKIECWSLGGDMVNQVEDVGGSFVAVRRGSHEEARAIIVDIAETLLRAFNSSEKIRPYLAQFPLTADRLKLEMDFRKRNYCPYYDGSTVSVILEKGELTYHREILEDGKKIANDQVYTTESYEEALQKTKISTEKSGIFLNLFQMIKNWIF